MVLVVQRKTLIIVLSYFFPCGAVSPRPLTFIFILFSFLHYYLRIFLSTKGTVYIYFFRLFTSIISFYSTPASRLLPWVHRTLFSTLFTFLHHPLAKPHTCSHIKPWPLLPHSSLNLLFSPPHHLHVTFSFYCLAFLASSTSSIVLFWPSLPPLLHAVPPFPILPSPACY